MSTEEKDLWELTQDALSDVYAKREKSILTRWVVVAETVEDSGERGLWIYADKGNKAWETLGLLNYAAEYEKAKLHRDLNN